MESAERYSHLQMPRKLKTYQTSQGFYDLAVATPSMKAALEAWGSKQKPVRRRTEPDLEQDEQQRERDEQ